MYLEAFDNPSSIIVFCRALNRSKKIKHLVLSSNNLRMANNKDVEGALENVVTLNLANCVTSRWPENGKTNDRSDPGERPGDLISGLSLLALMFL